MKKIYIAFFILFISFNGIYAQSPVPENSVKNNQVTVSNPDWANGDWLITGREPVGRPSGVYRPGNSSVYVAVPDTNAVLNRCLTIYRSTNNGISWLYVNSISTTAIVPKVKMVNAGADSIYCFFLYGSSVYCWNIVSGSYNQFTAYTNIKDFDAVASSTHSLYLAIDLIPNADVRVYGSSDGGATWPTSNYMSSAGATPRMYMSSTGDTCVLNYFYTLTADTGSSAVRSWRLRESAAGTLLTIAAVNAIAAGTFKDQFQPVVYAGKAWLFYTTGTTGNINLNCIQSNDNGATYGSPFTVGTLTGRDEYWFDAQHFIYGSGGVDIIFYSDSITGTPSNTTDRLYYTYINYSSPVTVQSLTQISQHWPFWSARMYIPTLIEFYNTSGEAGAIWVGGPSPYKLYYDAGSLTTRINNNQSEIPEDCSLGQNYPNPFNPTTKIDFSITKSGNVRLKIYDILGKEVASVIDKEMNAGSYTVDFNASSLSSGTYFYKLTSGSFTQTRRMTLVK
jgi:hypothetical protein